MLFENNNNKNARQLLLLLTITLQKDVYNITGSGKVPNCIMSHVVAHKVIQFTKGQERRKRAYQNGHNITREPYLSENSYVLYNIPHTHAVIFAK